MLLGYGAQGYLVLVSSPSRRFGLLHISPRRLTASLDSAPRSGRGGRRFKSCHSDHYLAPSETPIPTVSPTDTPSTFLLPSPALGECRHRSLACRLIAVGRRAARPPWMWRAATTATSNAELDRYRADNSW